MLCEPVFRRGINSPGLDKPVSDRLGLVDFAVGQEEFNQLLVRQANMVKHFHGSFHD